MLRQLSNSKFLIPAMVILAVLAAASGFYISLKQSQNQSVPTAVHAPSIEGLFWPNPKQIKDFNTRDHNGNAFGLDQIKGKWSFIFFGYTHCPDVCPVTLSVMTDAYKQLTSEYDDIQTIFVSVDFERDKQKSMSQYVSYFHQDFVGLAGDPNRTNSLTKQIGVAYYLNNAEQKKNYLVDHSASIFLFDPQARFVGIFSAPHETAEVINRFTKIKEFIDAQN